MFAEERIAGSLDGEASELSGLSAGQRGAELASSAQSLEPLRLTGWKEEAAATAGCNVRKAAAPGAGRGRAQQPPPASLAPRAAAHRNSPKSGSLSVRARVHPVLGPALGESQR